MKSHLKTDGVPAHLLNEDGRLKHLDRQILKPGSRMSAAVYAVAVGSDQWVLKDFSETNYLVRHTFGRLMVRREWKSLCRLQGLAGIPVEPFLVKPFAFGYRFMAGETLSSLRRRQAPLGQAFFLALEQLVAQLHARGFVHLDLRNGKNILIAADHRPRLLDFQSGLWLHHFPQRVRRSFEKVDYSGVYKWWLRMDPGSLDPERRDMLQIINRRRQRWWRFNYPYQKTVYSISNSTQTPGSMNNARSNLIVQLFNHPGLRKFLRQIRIPVAILAAGLLAYHTRPEWFWPGLAVSAVGELLQLWCFASLHKQQTLATNGLYKVVRNPMYLARFLLLAGCLMFLGNWILLAIFVPLYYFYMVNRVGREEARLQEIFGEPYKAYCRRVSRFIPFMGINNDGRFWFFRLDYFLENHGHWNALAQFAFYVLCYVLAFRPFG